MKRFSESDIIDAIGEIDEKYIRESERRAGFLPLVKYSSAVAACLAVALITGVALYSSSKREDPPKPPVIEYTSTSQSSIPQSSATESERVSGTVSEKVTESVTESTTEVTTEETTTVTESETTIPVIPPETPTTPLPTEPEIPTEEPEESTEPEETEEPATESATESPTEDPVAPSDPVTSEPDEGDPVTSSSVTFPIGTGVIITNDECGAVDDTVAGIGTTPRGTSSIITEVVTSQVSTTEAEITSPPTGSVTTTGPSEDPDNYESEAPANGSSAGVSAYYLTKLPDSACLFEMPENTDADTVFANSTDIFSGDVVALRSVEVKMNGKRFYLSIAEIKVTKDAFKSSSNILTGSTVRILLPHGVNISDENLYDRDDIAGLLGETEMHGGGYGIFCTRRITESDKLTYGKAYYPLSNIADFVLPDGMNYLILSNPYHTWYNSETFSELYEIGGSLTNFNTAFDFFAEAKANGRL